MNQLLNFGAFFSLGVEFVTDLLSHRGGEHRSKLAKRRAMPFQCVVVMCAEALGAAL